MSLSKALSLRWHPLDRDLVKFEVVINYDQRDRITTHDAHVLVMALANISSRQ